MYYIDPAKVLRLLAGIVFFAAATFFILKDSMLALKISLGAGMAFSLFDLFCDNDEF